MKNGIPLMVAGLALLAFAACGGGGGSGPDPFDGPLTVPHDGSSGNLGDDPGGGSGAGGGGLVIFRVLETGAFSLISSPQTRVIRDATGYLAMWDAHKGPIPPGSKQPQIVPPSVDFSTETVIAVFLGGRPTGGYSVRILDIVPEGGDGVRMTVEETQPGTGCIVTQALTAPFVILAVPRYESATAFDFTTVTNNCP